MSDSKKGVGINVHGQRPNKSIGALLADGGHLRNRDEGKVRDSMLCLSLSECC